MLLLPIVQNKTSRRTRVQCPKCFVIRANADEAFHVRLKSVNVTEALISFTLILHERTRGQSLY